jgi:hypothetical protein
LIGEESSKNTEEAGKHTGLAGRDHESSIDVEVGKGTTPVVP